ncbi:hypothetical protein DENIT_20599 [Pseudomonas veronii]|jgi:hypothetical protein|nr:hypothetical protein DENIT_20599 [Pseudomonas veronii]SEB35430.1 hypothetical protein SAMN04490199_1095 [Pseudomonas marginalis]
MTTLTPIIASNPLIVRAVATPLAISANTVDVLPVRPASVVSLGNPAADVVDIYSRDGQMPGRESVRAWENSSQDAVSKIINTRFNSTSTASRYSGLGAALVAQFAKGGGADISQSVLNTTADRAGSDKGLLTGLADFKASIKQAVDSSNPMRPSEVDSFSYNVSQKTQVNGRSSADRSVTQNQQSVLSASFHKGLDGGKPPVFDGSRESQNYLYVHVQDRASSTASFAYKDSQLTRASVTQSASQNTHTQKYVMANLVEDTVVPKEGSSKRDYLALLEHAGRESKKSKDALEQSTLKDALAKMHDSVLLQDDPDVLMR